jgi:hypothetical protein
VNNDNQLFELIELISINTCTQCILLTAKTNCKYRSFDLLNLKWYRLTVCIKHYKNIDINIFKQLRWLTAANLNPSLCVFVLNAKISSDVTTFLNRRLIIKQGNIFTLNVLLFSLSTNKSKLISSNVIKESS